jgi:ABC-type transport system involved in cytochrome c biogenesis permease subunit
MAHLDLIVTLMISAAICVYFAAWVMLCAGKSRNGIALFCTGWGINLSLVALNWVAGGHPPFGNMYHVLIFLGLCFLPACLVLRYKDGLKWIYVYFAFTSFIPLFGPLFMERDVLWNRVPALQSPWFVPHVVAYMFSYSLAAVAFVLTLAGMVKNLWKKGEVPDAYAEASYHTMRLAFPLMTFGMLSGALWAEEAWGVYWSWDPKETWSLITWTLYIIYFHCRTRKPLMKYAQLAQILAFLALLTTFLLVNLLPKLSSELHSYGSM